MPEKIVIVSFACNSDQGYFAGHCEAVEFDSDDYAAATKWQTGRGECLTGRSTQGT